MVSKGAACLSLLMMLTCHRQHASGSPGEIVVGDKPARPGDCGLRHYVRPLYPGTARKGRAHDAARIRAVIWKTGELGDIEVLSGDPIFVPAAVTALKEWRYDPCPVNGERAEVRSGIAAPANR